MDIGLVDPILPAHSTRLDTTPSQVTLLFTSYEWFGTPRSTAICPAWPRTWP